MDRAGKKQFWEFYDRNAAYFMDVINPEELLPHVGYLLHGATQESVRATIAHKGRGFAVYDFIQTLRNRDNSHIVFFEALRQQSGLQHVVDFIQMKFLNILEAQSTSRNSLTTLAGSDSAASGSACRSLAHDGAANNYVLHPVVNASGPLRPPPEKELQAWHQHEVPSVDVCSTDKGSSPRPVAKASGLMEVSVVARNRLDIQLQRHGSSSVTPLSQPVLSRGSANAHSSDHIEPVPEVFPHVSLASNRSAPRMGELKESDITDSAHSTSVPDSSHGPSHGAPRLRMAPTFSSPTYEATSGGYDAQDVSEDCGSINNSEETVLHYSEQVVDVSSDMCTPLVRGQSHYGRPYTAAPLTDPSTSRPVTVAAYAAAAVSVVAIVLAIYLTSRKLGRQ